MCYTLEINMHIKEMEKELLAEFSRSRVFNPGYYFSAFDLPQLPVVTAHEPRVITTRQWGLVPFWVKDRKEAEKIRFTSFLSRAEMVGSKQLFKEAFARRRCLIIATGFFEWQHRGKERIPHYIHPPERQLLTLAGVHERWTDRESGEILETCALITTKASRFYGAIHNSDLRMPAIIDRDLRSQWLDAGLEPQAVSNLLTPYREDGLTAHTISKLISSRVDSAQKNVPELIEEHAYGSLF